MKTLILLRHAKSSWSDPSLDDFDRPLNNRGVESASAMGAYLAKNSKRIDFIACSEAARAKETAELFKKAYNFKGETDYLHSLYHASAKRIFSHVQNFSNQYQTAMLVAHNPGMHDFILQCCTSMSLKLFPDILVKYPTAAAATIQLPCKSWQEAEPKVGNLINYKRPREIRAK